MHRENSAQFLKGPFRELVRSRAIIGMVLPVRLGHTQIQVSVANTVDISDGTTRCMGAFDIMFGRTAVHQTANCATNLIINTSFTTGPDHNIGFRHSSRGIKGCP